MATEEKLDSNQDDHEETMCWAYSRNLHIKEADTILRLDGVSPEERRDILRSLKKMLDVATEDASVFHSLTTQIALTLPLWYYSDEIEFLDEAIQVVADYVNSAPRWIRNEFLAKLILRHTPLFVIARLMNAVDSKDNPIPRALYLGIFYKDFEFEPGCHPKPRVYGRGDNRLSNLGFQSNAITEPKRLYSIGGGHVRTFSVGINHSLFQTLDGRFWMTGRRQNFTADPRDNDIAMNPIEIHVPEEYSPLECCRLSAEDTASCFFFSKDDLNTFVFMCGQVNGKWERELKHTVTDMACKSYDIVSKKFGFTPYILMPEDDDAVSGRLEFEVNGKEYHMTAGRGQIFYCAPGGKRRETRLLIGGILCDADNIKKIVICNRGQSVYLLRGYGMGNLFSLYEGFFTTATVSNSQWSQKCPKGEPSLFIQCEIVCGAQTVFDFSIDREGRNLIFHNNFTETDFAPRSISHDRRFHVGIDHRGFKRLSSRNLERRISISNDFFDPIPADYELDEEEGYPELLERHLVPFLSTLHKGPPPDDNVYTLERAQEAAWNEDDDDAHVFPDAIGDLIVYGAGSIHMDKSDFHRERPFDNMACRVLNKFAQHCGIQLEINFTCNEPGKHTDIEFRVMRIPRPRVAIPRADQMHIECKDKRIVIMDGPLLKYCSEYANAMCRYETKLHLPQFTNRTVELLKDALVDSEILAFLSTVKLLDLLRLSDYMQCRLLSEDIIYYLMENATPHDIDAIITDILDHSQMTDVLLGELAHRPHIFLYWKITALPLDYFLKMCKRAHRFVTLRDRMCYEYTIHYANLFEFSPKTVEQEVSLNALDFETRYKFCWYNYTAPDQKTADKYIKLMKDLDAIRVEVEKKNKKKRLPKLPYPKFLTKDMLLRNYPTKRTRRKTENSVTLTNGEEQQPCSSAQMAQRDREEAFGTRKNEKGEGTSNGVDEEDWTAEMEEAAILAIAAMSLEAAAIVNNPPATPPHLVDPLLPTPLNNSNNTNSTSIVNNANNIDNATNSNNSNTPARRGWGPVQSTSASFSEIQAMEEQNSGDRGSRRAKMKKMPKGKQVKATSADAAQAQNKTVQSPHAWTPKQNTPSSQPSFRQIMDQQREARSGTRTRGVSLGNVQMEAAAVGELTDLYTQQTDAANIVTVEPVINQAEEPTWNADSNLHLEPE